MDEGSKGKWGVSQHGADGKSILQGMIVSMSTAGSDGAAQAQALGMSKCPP